VKLVLFSRERKQGAGHRQEGPRTSVLHQASPRQLVRAEEPIAPVLQNSELTTCTLAKNACSKEYKSTPWVILIS
jgi:hypothetical protein